MEFAWDKHDGNTFGVQTIKDRKNNAEITIRFLKRNSKSRYGNQWTVRIAGKPLDDSIEFGISMSYYFGFNNVGGEFLSPTIDGDSFAISGSNDSPFTIIGKSNIL